VARRSVPRCPLDLPFVLRFVGRCQRVGLHCLLLGLLTASALTACREDPTFVQTDAAPDPEDADSGAPDAPDPGTGSAPATPDASGPSGAGLDAAPGAGGRCPETPPGSRLAVWPIPHPAEALPGPMARAHSYDTSSPEVVVDRVTGLAWQRRVDAQTRSWAAASEYCACLTLAGEDNWRLPTRMEMVSIVDFTRNTPAIDPTAFPDTPPEWFWTSSRRPDDPTLAWYVYFENGFSNFIEQGTAYRVRCVRSSGPGGDGPLRRYRPAGGTVLDVGTGLTWQQTADATMRTWAEAKAACAALPLAGGGWRLPSMKELQSLIDDNRASPAIDPVAFPDTSSDPFWSGTPVAGFPDSAWRVSFMHGYTYDSKDFNPYLVRCVR
jgi:hypothetical protein